MIPPYSRCYFFCWVILNSSLHSKINFIWNCFRVFYFSTHTIIYCINTHVFFLCSFYIFRSASNYEGILKIDVKIKHHIVNLIAKELTEVSANILKRESKSRRGIRETLEPFWFITFYRSFNIFVFCSSKINITEEIHDTHFNEYYRHDSWRVFFKIRILKILIFFLHVRTQFHPTVAFCFWFSIL